jgi:hypothetical protein
VDRLYNYHSLHNLKIKFFIIRVMLVQTYVH